MTDTWIQILAALGAGGILTAAVNGYLNRRKLGAEATKIITDAAASTVKDVREDNARLRLRVEHLEQLEDAWESERQAWRDVLMLHAAFDHLVVKRLQDEGITDLPSPPPLYPPSALRSE